MQHMVFTVHSQMHGKYHVLPPDDKQLLYSKHVEDRLLK
jgi:hypothetical protein